ncbi:hypothetical protein Tco_1002869 [Tanacetum coccineum]|uniref:Integrase, catalytic region, zinc finger, CCHC-type, peptidase aspartic, catalytic n=1 Tax=Tanacetum coccineum TaxID=301880 RepID=A0ABQ5F7L1_9ASTR
MSLSLAENVIVVSADNRPPMLDKSNYSSWASLIVRERNYTDLTADEKLRESVDIIATNIVLQGLPQDIYNLVNHNDQAKKIWDRVKLLIQGSELTKQERESKLYDDFDMFTSQPGETIHAYYMRQHEAHANEVRLNRERLSDQTALVADYQTCMNSNQFSPHTVLQHSYQVPAVQQTKTYQPQQQLFPQLDLGLVPSFNTSDDPIVNLNKAVAFVTSYASRFSPTNNQLRTSSNPRNQATIQDGRVTVQTVQGRQN